MPRVLGPSLRTGPCLFHTWGPLQAGQSPTTLRTVWPCTHLRPYLKPQFASRITSLGEGCNYDPELFLLALTSGSQRKGTLMSEPPPPRPRVQETPHWPSYTLRIHGGLVTLHTQTLPRGCVPPPPDPDLAPNCQAVGEVRSSRTRLLPPQLGWVGSSGGGLEAALGLRGQPAPGSKIAVVFT